MRFVAAGAAFEDHWDLPAHDVDAFLVVGRDVVVQHGEHIHIGATAFRIDEVRGFAEQGANLPLAEGGLLQAALALLVVA
jgi:hypothetical protein